MIESLSQMVNTWATQSLEVWHLGMPLYFLAGLSGSLFPCVYPLYPITAGFLRNRSLPGEAAWKHPFLYWCGMMLAYTLLGVLAAVSGGAFNRIMQSGLVIVITGFLFLFLAFVCLDWFSLSWDLGERWTQRLAARKGSFFTLLMGNVAGLVASACVAPVLVTMLVLLAKHSADDNVYRILYGGSLCLAFGGGIGLPFFLTGVLGARLPRSGLWQMIIKYGFALSIALAALYQLEKGFQVMGWNDHQIYLVFGGMFLLFLAVLWGLEPARQKDRRAQTKFYFALLALAFGLGLILRGFSVEPVTKKAAELKQEYESIGQLRFYRHRDFALNLAAQERRPIFIDFYAEWCANCKAFNKLIQNDQRLQAALAQAILLKVYDTDPVYMEFAADPRFPELKIGLPFFAVLRSNGDLHWKTTNYQDIDGMVRALQGSL